MSSPDPFGERAEPARGEDPGLVDPRPIHPSSEGVFSDGSEASESGPDPVTTDEEATPDDEVRGMVDPRREAAGPDL